MRGNRLVDPIEYDRQASDADGLGLTVRNMGTEGGAKKSGRSGAPAWRLRMRRSDEGQGVLILGDIGTGKSQIIQQFLQQMAGREGEAAIVYDPAREFVKSHYRPERGDVILNPLDNRSPFWSPILERKYGTDYQLLADAFFPGRNAERIQKAGAFFLNASREIFARMLEFEPTPAQLVEWLADEKEIDRMCVGTELANYIPPNAFNQRGGVLGSIATLAKTMRLLPSREECDFDFSLTEWAHERRGWLFLTATKETEERLRPLYAAHLDLLMRRLMSIDDAWGRQHPVKLIMDGVHSLPSLPTFEKVLMEGRKFGVDTILATQNKHQIDDLYGRDAALTMLSSPRYKVVLRSSEPDSAKWLSRLLGDEELERSRATAAAYTGHRPLVSREEISNLTDLAGYLKYDGMVVPFRFDFMAQQEVAAGFVPRQSLGSDKNLESAVQPEGGLWSLSGLEGMIKHWDKN